MKVVSVLLMLLFSKNANISMLLIKIIAENKSFEHFVRILRAYDELQPCLHELAG